MTAPLILAIATPLEAQAVLDGFPGLPATWPAPGQTLPLDLDGRPYILLITGVGPIRSAASLGRALAAHPEAGGVLNLGVAGTYNQGLLPLGACVAATLEICPEYGLLTGRSLDADGLGFAQAEGPHGPVFDRIPLDPAASARAMDLTLPAGLRRAAFLSVGMVSGDQDRAACLAERYSAGLENMEGFSLALAALDRPGLPFLEVRAVSNRVGWRPPQGWNLPAALDGLGRVFRALTADGAAA